MLRRITKPKRARAVKSVRDTIASNRISNVGQLIECLQTYSPDEPLETVNHELLQSMLRTLRTILQRPRSARNLEKIRAIDGCYLDNEIYRHFPQWERDPATFWEPPAEAFPAYCSLSGKAERLRAFFSHALVLEVEFKVRQIQWRFVTIMAFKHFERRHPRANLKTDKVRDYLLEIGLEATETNVSRCHHVITSGKRRTEFCQKLQVVSVEQAQADREENQHPVNYGPMFMSSIPDDLWDNKDGCRGSTVDDCLAYLLSLEAGTWTTDVGCESLARRLIAFHDDLIWRDVTQLTINQDFPSNGREDTASPQLAGPMLEQVIATTNSPWQFLLSAAESVTPQAQQVTGAHHHYHGAAFTPAALDLSNDQRSQDSRTSIGDFSKTGVLQPMMRRPPALASFDNTELLEGNCATTTGALPEPPTHSNAEESDAFISADFVNNAMNNAIALDDLSIILWQNEQSLLSACDEAGRHWAGN
ncbi:hypothetical protein BBO_08608 [Beauveria brongniartii RCEF 3172]|uniref:Uncharacterized protein n=1 Tax=Beauveria brongniartii RCEF 3172 TaxID=1081107 RepID=A0A166X9T5_9HYPO|nr:hypothetical protein BBO_08608 [Beauveria brongniartii RCEF 3172]